jgi:hypothetical protein
MYFYSDLFNSDDLDSLTLKQILNMEAFAKSAVTKLTKVNRKQSNEQSSTSASSTESSTAVGSAAATPNNNNKIDYRKSSDRLRLQLKDFVKTMCKKCKLFQEKDDMPYHISAVKDVDADELLRKMIDAIYNRMFGTFTTKTFIISDLNESLAAVPPDENDIALWKERDTITITPFPKLGLHLLILCVCI